MGHAVNKQPESHYKLEKLHIVFALITLTLLAVIGAVFLTDYDREWKKYQKNFHSYQIEVARTKLDAEENLLKNNSEYQELLKDIQSMDKFVATHCTNTEDLDDDINGLKTKSILNAQELKLVSAQRDAARYKYENAAGHHIENREGAKVKYDDLEKRLNLLEKDSEIININLNEKIKITLQCGNSLRDLNHKKRKIESKRNVIKKNLKSIDPNQMDFTNRIAQMVRDLPIIDLSTPTVKIDQIVLKDITDNRIIRQVPKVDRCTTCHLGIDKPDFKNFPQPYKTHPNLDKYVGNNSDHPIEEFGCTVCHGGRGRATGFVSAQHTPRNDNKKQEWIKKYKWKKDHHWEEPMFPLQLTEAGCYKCHNNDSPIKGAETLNLGLGIIEKAGCYACHEIDRYRDWSKPGPDLTKISSKLSKTFTYKWIEDPHFFRKDTWMPAYFHLANNSDFYSSVRADQEIHTIVNYLFSSSQDFSLEDLPKKLDPQKGKILVESIGCFACHTTQSSSKDTQLTKEVLRRQDGPTLSGLGTKTSKKWIYNWLKDPMRYHPETQMPNMRLSDQEAGNIAEYLIQDKHKLFVMKSIPGFDEEIINDITLDFLKKQNSTKDAMKKLDVMNLNEKMYFSGKKLISQYGCYSCHNINGFEDAKPIGISLTEEGDKPLHKLDFAYIHIDHTKHSWFDQKLKSPRSFDKHKVKRPDEKLVMPNFKLTVEERTAVVTAILGFVNDITVRNKKNSKMPRNLKIQEGEKIIKQFNCRSCHEIDGAGGNIQSSIKSWLQQSEGKEGTNADKLVESFSPPSLHGVGRKIDSQWLFNFLHDPKKNVRPWLKVRMPTYNFNVGHLNSLVQFFTVLDGEENFPFNKDSNVSMTPEEYKSAEKLFSPDYLDCTKCHVVGDKIPTGTKDTWAPDLALAKTRLKPEWLIQWIKNPQAISPGTKMPTFFDPEDYENSGATDIMDGDEDRQIHILRNYLMTLADEKPKKPKKFKKIKKSNQLEEKNTVPNTPVNSNNATPYNKKNTVIETDFESRNLLSTP